jgi:cysteinyl-tRNA synthetase
MHEIRIYNTLTRRRDVLETREEGKVGLYVCGPTVYDHAHLGHARVYVLFDTLVRFLEHRGYQVTYVRNITDIDDKIIKKASETGQSCQGVAGTFIESFASDMEALNVRRPTIEPRATEHVQEMIEIVDKLVDRGMAYPLEGDVYFSLETFGGYGKLSGRDLDQLMAGARVEVDTRLRNPHDFALWKASRPGEPSWDSPWGPGRPGWHIECSAMSLKYLGAGFDIHGGGLDLIFPHHENEIAQSEGALGTPFCSLFMHNGFVNVNREKMAKSKGNFFLIRQILEHAHPEAIRLFLLGTHYRGPIDLLVTIDADGTVGDFPQIAEAQKRTEYYYETLGRLERASAGGGADRPDIDEAAGAFLDAVDAALCDDFNTARAVGHLNDFMRNANELVDGGAGGAAAARALEALHACGGLLGIMQSSPEDFSARLRDRKLAALGLDAERIEARIAARREARARKDWAAADAIRDELAGLGIELRDAGDGTDWTVRG